MGVSKPSWNHSERFLWAISIQTLILIIRNSKEKSKLVKSLKRLIIYSVLSAQHGPSVALGTLLRPPFGAPRGSSSSQRGPLEGFWNLAYEKIELLQMYHTKSLFLPLQRDPKHEPDHCKTLQEAFNSASENSQRSMLRNRWPCHRIQSQVRGVRETPSAAS